MVKEEGVLFLECKRFEYRIEGEGFVVKVGAGKEGAQS